MKTHTNVVLSIPGDLKESASKSFPATAVARVVWRRPWPSCLTLRLLPLNSSIHVPHPEVSLQWAWNRRVDQRSHGSVLTTACRGPCRLLSGRHALSLGRLRRRPRSSQGLRGTTSYLLLPAQAALTGAHVAERQRPCCQRQKALV